MKEKARHKHSACDGLVRLKGFEPPTYWFVASHSIQLSYSRIPPGEWTSLTAQL